MRETGQGRRAGLSRTFIRTLVSVDLAVKLFGDPVLFVEDGHSRAMLWCLFGRGERKREDDDAVPFLGHPGEGSVHLNRAGPPSTLNNVRLSAMPIGAVRDQDLFVGKQADRVHDVAIDRHAAVIVKLRLGDGGHVKFGLEQTQKHVWTRGQNSGYRSQRR